MGVIVRVPRLFFGIVFCMFLTDGAVSQGFVKEGFPPREIDEEDTKTRFVMFPVASKNIGSKCLSNGMFFVQAEKVWICCRKELQEITKTIQDLNHSPKPSRKILKRSLLLYLNSKRSSSSNRDECEECIYTLYNHNIQSRHSHHRQTRKWRPNARKEASSSARKGYIRLESQKKPPDHVILLGIAVSTAVASLALFLLFLFCCLGGKEQKSESDFEGKDEKPVVDTGPGHISGASQTSNVVEGNKNSNNSPSTNNFWGNAASQTPEAGKLPLPPGRRPPPPSTSPSSSSQPPPKAPKAPSPPKPPAPKAPPPPRPGNTKRPPGPPRASGNENDPSGSSNSSKTKLKPLFWDKMNMSPNQSMVWNEVKAGSFQLDEEMMESLFGFGVTHGKGNNGKAKSNLNSQPKFIQIIDPRKAQNLAITLKALSVTTEKVCNALKEGTDLPVQLITTLIKMPPTQEEEVKLRLYSGDLGLLGPADHLLKLMIEIPFVYKRLEALLLMSSLNEESSPLKNAFETLEVACTKLKNSRLFLKLLEAVLKTGNRMNVGTYRGGAQAIKLDTLLKLSDVKGTDGKTTLLTFVVQEIIRSEGMKAARKQQTTSEHPPEYYCKLGLEVVAQLSNELQDIKKAAMIDGDYVTSTVLKLGNMLGKTKDLVTNELNTYEEAMEFCEAFNGFMENAETEITWMLEEEKKIMALVKSTGDYFHGNSAKDEGIRLFVIVRDFLKLLDKVCVEIKKTNEINSKKKDTPVGKKESLSNEARQQTWVNVRDKLFPGLKGKKMDYSTSDDEDDDEDVSP
ncbi:formin-like protein 3 [Bidens hawaiensis]|uniref:formin-like protein 3 n=1 Tax=Bidens hawaiensis TaxID=980011 RepID=UPI00404B9C37